MTSSWKETTLGEVAEFCYGKMPEKDRVTLTGDYPIFSGYRIVGYYDEYNSDEDLIVVARGVGGTGDVKISPPKSYVTNLSIIVKLKEDEVSRKYLAYRFLNNNLRYLDSGSAQSQITISDLQKIDFLLPPLPEQKAIAAVLSSFDDKIELLRRQNKTLEEIAQTIFKEWFVHFTVNGKKLRIDGATGLPKGWRMGKLPNIIEINPLRKIKKGESAPYLDMKGMPTQGHRAEGWYNREFSSGSKFANGDTLLARITPCLENGKTAFVDFLDEGQVGWGSTEFLALRSKPPFPLFYGYLLARSSTFRNFAIGQMTGSSGRQRVPEDALANYDVVVPSDDVLIKFTELIEPLVRRLTLSGKQIQTLSKLRDLLLPKLMKGEIRVKL